jgi:hypothetical protein
MFKKFLHWLWNETYEVCVLISMVMMGIALSAAVDLYVVDKLHWSSTTSGFLFGSGMVYAR